MITLIKKSNATAYNWLYEQAELDLKTNGIMTEYKLDSEGNPTEEVNHITSLEEYFSYIKELSVLNKIKYTTLPLDEDVFEIDLNTRTITVPAAFAKNGISVQGDEIAEVVYFRCNRYFDAVDLQTRRVFIQWESAAKDENGKAIKGVSVPWSVDYESEPGYIIIGWPLSTKITSAPGTVKFSVRFYEWNEDLQQITYSLSTLVQTATIKPGFDYDLKEMILDGSLIDDARSLILDRFENTIPVNAQGDAANPEIIGYLVRKGTVNFTILTPNKAFERQCLAENEEGFKANPIELAIAAVSEDAGRLSYEWKRRPLDPAEGDQFVLIPSELKYIVTADTDRVEGKLYFEKVSDDHEAYQVYEGVFSGDPDEPEENQPEIPTIYERVSAASVDSTGYYKVLITNRVNNATGNTESLICIVPAPEAPVINTDVAERAALRANDYDVTLSVGAEAPDEGKLTYQWKRIAPGAEQAEVIEDANEAEFVVNGTEEVIDGVAVGDGTYFVEITNNLNKEANMIVSGACRVTHAASIPEVALDANTEPNMRFNVASEIGVGVDAEIKAEAGESRTEADSLTYQWYRYSVGSNTTSELDHQKAANGLYEVDGDTPIPEATEARYMPTLADAGKVLFCQVTNTYNGDAASICSPFIDLQDV